MIVVLPAPVGPTIATSSPGLASKDMSVRTGWRTSQANPTCSNATRPDTGGKATAFGASRISDCISRISKIRAVAPCASRIWANTRAAELKGPMRMPAKSTKANNSPGDTAPSMTWRPPYHKTAAAAANVSRLITGIKTAIMPARRMVSDNVWSICDEKRVSSRCVWTNDLTTRMPAMTSSISVLSAAV